MFRRDTRTSVINSFFVFLGPTPKFLQDSHLLFRNGSIFLRADVQQQISSHTQAVDKRTQQDKRRFIIGIRMLISPRVIHRHTQLPVFILRTHNRNPLFRSRIISITLDTGIDNHILIIRTQQIYNALWIPSLSRLFPVTIKPIQIRLPRFVQFRQLCHIKFHKTFPTYRIIRITHISTCHIRIIRMRPVQQWIIKSQLQPLFANFFYKRTD